MSGNWFQDRGRGSHIRNRATPIFERNLPLPMTNAHTKYFLVRAIGSTRNVRKPFQDRGRGSHIWNRATPIFERNLHLPMTNAHTKYILVRAIGSTRNVRKPISRSRLWQPYLKSSGAHLLYPWPMHTQNSFQFVQSVLLEMSGNWFQDRGYGGHIWNRAAAIWKSKFTHDQP